MILLTGATGELGRSLVARLVDRFDVAALTRDAHRNTALRALGVRLVVGDLTRPETLGDAVAGAEQVLHMGALTHTHRVSDYFAINEIGTRNLVAAAEASGSVVRFVHLSTRAIGEVGGAYSASKLRAEAAVRSSPLPSVILRPAEVYGGGADAITDLLARIRRSRWLPILGDGQYRLAPVYVEDVNNAIVTTLATPALAGSCYTLSGPEEMTFLQLVERLEAFAAVGRRRRIPVPVVVARCAVRLTQLFGVGQLVPDQIPRLLMRKATDDGAAASDLAFAPRRLEDGLRAMGERPSIGHNETVHQA